MSEPYSHRKPDMIGEHRVPVADPARRPLRLPRGRWPRQDDAGKPGTLQGAGAGAGYDLPGQFAAANAAALDRIGDLTAAVAALVGPVLHSAVYQLDATGVVSDTFRAPFAAASIVSQSANPLVFANGPRQLAAPGPGPGSLLVPANGFRLGNVAGRAFTIYGGAGGELVEVQLLGRAVEPNMVAQFGSAGVRLIGQTVSILEQLVSDYPATFAAGASPVTASSGNVANAAAVATLPGAAGRTTYITGFELTATGSTAAAIVLATVAGTVSGTLTYVFLFPAGVTALATPLVVPFPKPIPASAANTAITVTLPAGGAGNTNAAAVAHGYQL